MAAAGIYVKPEGDGARKASTTKPPPKAIFGTLLGTTHGGVGAYSSHYKSIDQSPFKGMKNYEETYNGVVTGYKYQCVEFARRYLVANRGVVFDSIPMAYDIFHLKSVRRVGDGSDGLLQRMAAHPNGSATPPEVGSLLIWSPIGFFSHTGHVAVVVAVTPTHIDIVEQNVEDAVWPAGQNYSRRIPVVSQTDPATGKLTSYSIVDVELDDGIDGPEPSHVLGWMTVLDELFEHDAFVNCSISQLQEHTVPVAPRDAAAGPWLDTSKLYSRQFFDAWGESLSDSPTSTFYTLTETGETGLSEATSVVHKLFMAATDYALLHQSTVRASFALGDKLWPLIRRSWYASKRDTISGRLDWTITPTGLKCYEYNADSASCLFECGEVQDKYAKAAGYAHVGRDVGSNLFPSLVDAWKAMKIEGVLHLLCDDVKEERYHTSYMASAAEEAGVTCKVTVGRAALSSWSFDAEGRVLDADGLRVDNVWKTFNWNTVIGTLGPQSDIDWHLSHVEFPASAREGLGPIITPTGTPTLHHFLIDPRVRVFEPLWTVLPASKAILPLLWVIAPRHPFLLNSAFQVTPELAASGYAAKPVKGRAGREITLHSSGTGSLLEESKGASSEDSADSAAGAVPASTPGDPIVYQELALLPVLAGKSVQLNTWVVHGAYGGPVVRAATGSAIVDISSQVYVMRVVSDVEAATAGGAASASEGSSSSK